MAQINLLLQNLHPGLSSSVIDRKNPSLKAQPASWEKKKAILKETIFSEDLMVS